MWVLLSEMFPLKFKGLAIGVIAFVMRYLNKYDPFNSVI